MATPEEAAFQKVVEQVFNNWTALRLAVENSEEPNPKQTALNFVQYTTQCCLFDSVEDKDSIEDFLEDVLDQEFDTICEDGSTAEVANVFAKFLQIIKSGNTELYTSEFNALPVANEWLIKTQSKALPPTPVPAPQQNEIIASAASSSTDVPMEEDAEWTEVRTTRRKR